MKNLLRFAVFALCALAMSQTQAQTKPGAKPEMPSSVMKIIKEHKELSKFADLIGDAGLESMFDGKDKTLTVFAPTNDAIGKVASEHMKKAKSDKEHLQKFVKHHVITGSVVLINNLKGRKVAPSLASGESILLDGTGNVTKVEKGEVVTPDLQAANGIVHIVNAAMVPPSFIERPKEEVEAEMKKMHEREEQMMREREKAMREKGMPGAPAEGPESAPAEEAAPSQAPVGEPAMSPLPMRPAAPAGKPAEEKKGIKGWLKKLGW